MYALRFLFAPFFSENSSVSPKLVVFLLNLVIFVKMQDFPETIPAYLNFATPHMFFLYPEKLSYSSRNAYKENKSAGAWKANSSSQKPQKHLKLTSFFVMCTPFSKLLIL